MKIRLIRKNDYANSALPFNVFVNGKRYKLKSNSVIEIDDDFNTAEVYAKLFWLKSEKVILNDEVNNLIFSSIATDRRLLIFSVLIILFFILSYIYGGIFNLIFRLIAYTFFLFTILSFTLFYNRYLTINRTFNDI